MESVVADALSRDENAACQTTTVVPEWMKELEASYGQSEWLKDILARLMVQPTAVAGYTLSNGLVRYKGRLVVGNDTPPKGENSQGPSLLSMRWPFKNTCHLS